MVARHVDESFVMAGRETRDHRARRVRVKAQKRECYTLAACSRKGDRWGSMMTSIMSPRNETP